MERIEKPLTLCFSYLILLSRQGKVVRPNPLVTHPVSSTGLRPPPTDPIFLAASRQVVHYSLPQGKGQDHQGCDSTCPVPPDADVQFPRIQRWLLLLRGPDPPGTNSMLTAMGLSRLESRLPPICLPILHRRLRINR